MRKLVRALPDTFRADAEAAATAVVIDSTRWGDNERVAPPVVRQLQRAVIRRRKVRFDYAARQGRVRERLADPYGLVVKDDVWYLVAGTDNGERTFRVDRMQNVDVTDVFFERPVDFDLASAWERVVSEVEQRRAVCSATVLIEARQVWALQGQLGRHCDVVGPSDDGRMRVRVTAPMPVMIAQHLAGWGTAIEVIEPESVQAELARIGRELSQRYPAPA